MKLSLKNATMVIGLSFATATLACSIDGTSGFLPENDLYIPAGQKSMKSGLNELQFNQAIERVERVYSPIIANLGKKLVVKRNWKDGTVNAQATQIGSIWNVEMFGGLARHQTITMDGMSLVVCHEIGHHIGGAPKRRPIPFLPIPTWGTNEGQADYFATLKCLRKVFLNENNAAAIAAMSVPKAVVNACARTTRGHREDTALCVRMSMAGKSVSNLFAVMNKLPPTNFETPDLKVVAQTFDKHPRAQCRLDTYLQGALCDANFNEDVSQVDEVKGTCHAALGHRVGLRPKCWFKSK